jgi:hypothetical protein
MFEWSRLLTPVGDTQVTDLTTAVPLPGIPTAATRALVVVEGAAVRVTFDASLPTVTRGLLAPAGGRIEPTSADLLAGFRAIGVAAGATLRIAYFAEE